LPERPIARPPAALIAPTSCLLIVPARTISTTSIVSLSVTRSPFDKTALDAKPCKHAVDLRAAAMHHDRWMPTCFSSAMSRANGLAAAAPIAWPPYLTTIVSPE
jgi:hypothetical protein